MFSRRAFVLGGMQTGLLGVLAGRLAWLQIAEGKKYKTLSDKNRIHTKILAPSRGLIFDRSGSILAENTQNFRAMIVPEQSENVERILEKLRPILNLSDGDVERALENISKVAKFSSVEIKDDLSWEEVSQIEVNLPDFPGLSIDIGARRHYPLGEPTAHVIGYVGSVNQAELGEDPVLALPSQKIGKTGVEKSFESALRGRAGTAQVEVNVVGREIRTLDKQAAQDGDDLVLSLDAGLQKFTQDRVNQERSASAIIMDARTGAIYSMASGPSFDPNVFTKPLSASTWEEMLSNPGHPLTNKAVSGQYPPGSTFKMMTALAILEAGKAHVNDTVYCPGFYEYGSDRFHCWKRGGHGSMNVISALSQSCDVYFYKLATEVGIEKIAAMARQFGLGESYNFDLIEERKGLIPDKNWKLGRFGNSWQPGETIVASIGQGYMLTTPLQLAVMTARLVNGGYKIKPWLYANYQRLSQKLNTLSKVDVSRKNLDLVLKGMENVVNHEDGTALGSRIVEDSMKMGGKTGTAQVRRITMQQRHDGVKNQDLPWKSRHHALFVGYAPIHSPRYVASVVVEHGGGGSSAAAPLAKDLLLAVQKINPAGTPIDLAPRDHAEKNIMDREG